MIARAGVDSTSLLKSGVAALLLLAGLIQLPALSARPAARPARHPVAGRAALPSPAAAAAARASVRAAPVRDKWALVIGISRFQDESINLKYAAKDARDFYNYLVRDAHFAPDHVKLITDAQATRERIMDELGDSWLPRVANPDDLVLIYISSHGSPSQADVAGVNYIVTYNTDKNRLYSTGIPVQELSRMVKERVHSQRVVLVLDACHSGAAKTEGKGIFRQANFDAAAVAEGTGQMVICSSSPNQISWEGKDYDNGVFTRHLIKSLRGKGEGAPLSEAFASMKDQVQSEVLRDRGQLQTPVMKSKWEGGALNLAVLPVHPGPALGGADAGVEPGNRSSQTGSGVAKSDRPEILWDTYIEQGTSALMHGRVNEAERILKAALSEAERGGDDRRVATSLNNLAAVLDAGGKYADAERLYQRALDIDTRDLGKDHPDVALTLNNLSALYYKTGRNAEAESAARRALAVRENAHGSDHERVAAALDTLASALLAQNKYSEAEPLYERAVSIFSQVPGRNQGELARTLGNLAELYRRQQRYTQAEALMKRALAVDEAALGKNHPDVAVTLNNLAANYVNQGEFAQAEPLVQRSLSIYEATYGPDHPETAATLAGLASIYHREGRYAEAEELYKRALAVMDRSGQGSRAALASTLSNYADLMRKTSRDGAAEALEARVATLKSQETGR